VFCVPVRYSLLRRVSAATTLTPSSLVAVGCADAGVALCGKRARRDAASSRCALRKSRGGGNLAPQQLRAPDRLCRCVARATLSRRPGLTQRSRTEPSAAPVLASARYANVLLAVCDDSAYLTAGTRAACAAAAAHALAAGAGAKLTILVADPKPLPPGVDAGVRADTLRWHIAQAGWAQPPELLQRPGENAATAISDAAEDADCVVLAASAVHAKVVDVNLLAEFMPCPLLLVPF
jgi:hypothetical protein